MKLLLDPFDTKIFDNDVYKLHLKEGSGDGFLKLIRQVNKGIIFCFTPFSSENINLLQQAGFNLISSRNTYKLDLNSYLRKNIGHYPKGYKILDKSKSIKLLQRKDITQLADTILKTSRYSKDKFLEKDKNRKIYITWVNNSLYGSYADEAFLIFNQSDLSGMITLKIKDQAGSIDLLGVIRKYRKKGLATYLLKKAVDYFKTRNINNILVTTEGENIPANIFYQRNNFILQNVELVYHKHI